MEALVVKFRVDTFSIRKRMNQVYQESFILPPPSVLMGLAGAAMGLEYHEFYSPNSPLASVECQVLANNTPGGAPDLEIQNKLKIGSIWPTKSPYTRVVYFNAEFTVLYKAEEVLLERLAQAFEEPKRHLYLGRSDDLIDSLTMSISIEECQEVQEDIITFSGTILPKRSLVLDTKKYLDEEKMEMEIEEDIFIYKNPRRFILGKEEERVRAELQDLVFIPYGRQLTFRREQITARVFSYEGRAFVWL